MLIDITNTAYLVFARAFNHSRPGYALDVRVRWVWMTDRNDIRRLLAEGIA